MLSYAVKCVLVELRYCEITTLAVSEEHKGMSPELLPFLWRAVGTMSLMVHIPAVMRKFDG